MEASVKEVIDHIRPMLQADGGDIELVGVDEETGVVSVRLQGACKGCPGAQMTLKMGVERHLKEKVPEVTEVRSGRLEAVWKVAWTSCPCVPPTSRPRLGITATRTRYPCDTWARRPCHSKKNFMQSLKPLRNSILLPT